MSMEVKDPNTQSGRYVNCIMHVLHVWLASIKLFFNEHDLWCFRLEEAFSSTLFCSEIYIRTPFERIPCVQLTYWSVSKDSFPLVLFCSFCFFIFPSI